MSWLAVLVYTLIGITLVGLIVGLAALKRSAPPSWLGPVVVTELLTRRHRRVAMISLGVALISQSVFIGILIAHAR